MVVSNVILPVFFIIFLGFLLRLLGKLDVRVFSRTQLYILSPALVFSSIAGAEVGTPLLLKVLLYVTFLVVVLLGISQGAAFLMGRGRPERHAMALTSAFMNAGFYGIPVCMLAFGRQGLVYATVFMVASATVQATLGIFIASAGSRRAVEAIGTVLRVPLLYSVVLARFLLRFDLLPPEPLMEMIDLLGRAAIPIGLILLGMQLERIAFEPGKRPAEAGALAGPSDGSAAAEGAPAFDNPAKEAHARRRDMAGGLVSGMVRILAGFAAAIVILSFFDFDPLFRKVIIVESSMPTAVAAVVYATEFNCRPRLVAMGILASTLASVVSLSLILGFLE